MLELLSIKYWVLCSNLCPKYCALLAAPRPKPPGGRSRWTQEEFFIKLDLHWISKYTVMWRKLEVSFFCATLVYLILHANICWGEISIFLLYHDSMSWAFTEDYSVVVMNKSGGLIEWRMNCIRIFGLVLSNFLLLVCPSFTCLVSYSWVVCTVQLSYTRVPDEPQLWWYRQVVVVNKCPRRTVLIMHTSSYKQE